MLSELKRLFTECKLSGLLFGSCVLGGLGLGLGLGLGYTHVNHLVQNGQVYIGTVKQMDTDVETALVMKLDTNPGSSTNSDHGRPVPDTDMVRVSMNYFPDAKAYKSLRERKLIVVGNKVHDQYGRLWIIPCTDTWSGIYTNSHPIGWLL